MIAPVREIVILLPNDVSLQLQHTQICEREAAVRRLEKVSTASTVFCHYFPLCRSRPLRLPTQSTVAAIRQPLYLLVSLPLSLFLLFLWASIHLSISCVRVRVCARM